MHSFVPVPMDLNLAAENFIASLESWEKEEIGDEADLECAPCGEVGGYAGGSGSGIQGQVYSFVNNLKGGGYKGGGKGDGKAKGGKGFQGPCNFCGIWGHKASE